MATLKTGTTIGGSTAWHAGNDGTGTGLDADLIDGLNRVAPAQAATSLPAPRGVGDVGVDSDSVFRTWDATWQNLKLINGWIDYSIYYGDTYAPAQYRKTMSGLVFMRGLVMGGSGAIAVMPAGYRPQYHFLTSIMHSGNITGRIQVNSDGNVIPTLSNGNGWVSIHTYWYGY